MNLFELKNINYRHLFLNLNLEIQEHDLFVIMGPSGIGKSTFLRFFNRLNDPDSGTILFHNHPILSMPIRELRRKIGFLFQTPTLPEETVRENLLFGPKIHKRNISEQELFEYLRQVELDESFLDRKSSQLSIGEQQRVNLARVLANSPEVLLLDEPTASLDKETTIKLEKTIRELVNTKELTVLWVTHDPHQAERLGGTLWRIPPR